MNYSAPTQKSQTTPRDAFSSTDSLRLALELVELAADRIERHEGSTSPLVCTLRSHAARLRAI